MAWTERQRAMLQAMGLRVWAPDAEALPSAPLPTPPRPAEKTGRVPAPASVAAPSPAPAPAPAPKPMPAAAMAAPSPGPAVDVATLDWQPLREAVAACRACGLCETRRQTVFGVGDVHARWLVVGEAPGEQEDAQGEPFVGRAGELLDRMLAALGLTRDAGSADPARRVFITNTLKCRPPRNRNPAPDELAACEPFLQRQIALLQPRIILAMGRFAVQALLRSDAAIGRLRGQVHRYEGVPLVVTYHPAYLLRQPAHKGRAWDDLCLAAETAETAEATGVSPSS